MGDKKAEPLAVNLQDVRLAPASPDCDSNKVLSAEPTLTPVRKDLLDAVVAQHAQRISELERMVEKKKAKIERLSSPQPFLHHPSLCLVPHATAPPSPAVTSNPQKPMHPPPVIGTAFPKVTPQSQPPQMQNSIMAAAMAAIAAANNSQVSTPIPTHYPFIYGPPEHHSMGTPLIGVAPTPPQATPPPPPQPIPAPQASAPTQSSEGNERKQSRYWTADEHQRFLAAVNTCGAKNYVQISEFVGTRNAKQVRTHAQKFQKRLEREEARRRADMHLTGVEQPAASVGTAAAAAVAAAAAAAMHVNVPGAAGIIRSNDGTAGSGNPTSSSSGKHFYSPDRRDARMSVGVSVDGSSSTNESSREQNRTSDSASTGDHAMSDAAAAAAAAVAAEAAALGGGALHQAGIPSALENSTATPQNMPTVTSGQEPSRGVAESVRGEVGRAGTFDAKNGTQSAPFTPSTRVSTEKVSKSTLNSRTKLSISPGEAKVAGVTGSTHVRQDPGNIPGGVTHKKSNPIAQPLEVPHGYSISADRTAAEARSDQEASGRKHEEATMPGFGTDAGDSLAEPDVPKCQEVSKNTAKSGVTPGTCVNGQSHRHVQHGEPSNRSDPILRGVTHSVMPGKNSRKLPEAGSHEVEKPQQLVASTMPPNSDSDGGVLSGKLCSPRKASRNPADCPAAGKRTTIEGILPQEKSKTGNKSLQANQPSCPEQMISNNHKTENLSLKTPNGPASGSGHDSVRSRGVENIEKRGGHESSANKAAKLSLGDCLSKTPAQQVSIGLTMSPLGFPRTVSKPSSPKEIATSSKPERSVAMRPGSLQNVIATTSPKAASETLVENPKRASLASELKASVTDCMGMGAPISDVTKVSHNELKNDEREGKPRQAQTITDRVAPAEISNVDKRRRKDDAVDGIAQGGKRARTEGEKHSTQDGECSGGMADQKTQPLAASSRQCSALVLASSPPLPPASKPNAVRLAPNMKKPSPSAHPPKQAQAAPTATAASTKIPKH